MLCWPTNQGISKVCGMCRSLFFHLIALVAKKLIERWNICICIFGNLYVFILFIYWMCRSVIIHLLVLVAKSWLRLEILRRGRSWRGINWHQLVKQTSRQDSIWSAGELSLKSAFWVRAGFWLTCFTKCTQSSFTVRFEVQIRKGAEGMRYAAIPM